MIISMRYVEVIILQMSQVLAVSLCLLCFFFFFSENNCFWASFLVLLIVFQKQSN